MANQATHGDEARDAIPRGDNTQAEAVTATPGTHREVITVIGSTTRDATHTVVEEVGFERGCLPPVLDTAAHAGGPLFIIPEDVDGHALAALVVNMLRGTFTSLPTRAPGRGDRRMTTIDDIAMLTCRAATDDHGHPGRSSSRIPASPRG